MDESGTELRGIELRGIELRGIELRGIELKGTELSGIELKGMEERGIELSGIELSGIDERGVPASASVSSVTEDAVDGLLGSMPRLEQLSPRLLRVVHHVVRTSVSLGPDPEVVGVPGRGIELKGMEERGIELSGNDDSGEPERPRSPTSMPALSNRPAATLLLRTWPSVTDCRGRPLRSVPASTPGQSVQEPPVQPGG